MPKDLRLLTFFFLLAAITTGKVKYLHLLLALFSHFQSLIFLTGLIFSKFEKSIKLLYLRLAIVKADLIVITAGVLFGGFVLHYFSWKIFSKLEIYLQQTNGVSELFQLTTLLLLLLICSQKKLGLILALLPMLAAALLIGGDRVNMIGFTIAFYMMISEKSHNNPVVYSIMIYLSLKTIPFVYNVFKYGDGFAA